MPDVKLRALRPGACSGLACGGHITLVLKGAQMGWAADTKDRIVFLETTVWEPEKTRAMMDELVSRGYFRECAGVVFGDMGHGRSKLTGKALSDSIEEMAQVRRDFAAKATCPVYEDYPYGHISVSYTIDFLRRKTITADGIHRAGRPQDVTKTRRYYPHLAKGEGQYIALLHRTAGGRGDVLYREAL